MKLPNVLANWCELKITTFIGFATLDGTWFATLDGK